MTRRMNPEESNKLIEEMGGIEAFRESSEKFKKDTEFLQAHIGEWFEKYLNHWVVVYNEELMLATDDVGELLSLMWSEEYKGKSLVIEFLSDIPLILFTQETKSGAITSNRSFFNLIFCGGGVVKSKLLTNYFNML